MDKAYNHSGSEDAHYKAWEDSGLMRADNTSDKPAFTIPIPPPNVTGTLHLGHAAMLAIQDIMTRYKRMRGHEVLWVPGTDHASIATENVVLKHLGATTRENYSREDFLAHCREFAADKHSTITTQMKKMGSWLDWSREAYTFDEPRNHAVNLMFKKLYEDGLIERGYRLINWSVGAQSVISDDELEWDEIKEPFYYIKCGKFIMGTVRPETKCADSPLIVHPDEDYVEFENSAGENYIVIKRLFDDKEKFFKTLNLLDPEADYKVVNTWKGADMVGQKFEAETYAGTRNFHVIADEVIDPEKGSGAMTISASHSADDYDLAKRLGLDETFIEKINLEGKMTAIAGPCKGLEVIEARKKSGKIMADQDLLVGLDKAYEHRVPLCYRSGCVVEPMISAQWFIVVEKEYDHPVDGKTTLKKQMQAAVRENHVEIIPERFNKEYFRWIDNLQDWCISRQIWWGHRMPVWYDEENNIHLPEERKITFMRHGQSEANADNLVGGQSDAPLTEKGRTQAAKEAHKLKGKNITKIISSDLSRANETATIVRDTLGIDVEIEVWPEIAEVDYGDIVGTSKLKGETNLERSFSAKTGETQDQIVQRGKMALEKLKTLETDGEILVVSHGTFLCSLFWQQQGQTQSDLVSYRKRWHLKNAGQKEMSLMAPPKGKNLRQDEDTLDTWFSSALWPFSILGWPNEDSSDFQKFFPTSVLETGWDILFFWVARMIMFGRYATGQYPFETVYLHGMVTDEHGKKMSKSKGNGIDPLDMIAKFGADPVRLALVIGSSPGQNIPIGENKIKGYRNFVNKLWNAGRFIQFQAGENAEIKTGIPEPQSLAEEWILDRFSTVATEVQQNLDDYKISAAGDAIYHFVWDEFCDWFIEASKTNPNPTFTAAIYAEILKLVHPLCPFITEEIWKTLYREESMILEQHFPQSDYKNQASLKTFEEIQDLVTQIRSLRADNKLNPKEKLAVTGNITDTNIQKLVGTLAGVNFETSPEGEMSTLIAGSIELQVAIPVDEGKAEKEIEALKKEIANLEGRLSNKAYTDKAPETLVNQTRDQLTAAQEKLAKLTNG